jgi:2-polyprenyl-6-methoxyphenol hydroxylase-like FAD-dependent oxidoreductase
VLEREQQFKDRVRGEFLTPWAFAKARRLGIDELLRRKCAHEVRWVDFFSGAMLTAHRDVPASTPHQLPCLSYYHPAMQETLIAAAAGAGAEVRRGLMVQEVRPGTPAVLVAGSSGRREEIFARMVVGADGRSSSVRSWIHGSPHSRSDASGRRFT